MPTESKDERVRRQTREIPVRNTAKQHGLKLSRGRGGDGSPNRGLYRLINQAGETVYQTYVLGEVRAYLIRRAEQIRGGQHQPQHRGDTQP